MTEQTQQGLAAGRAVQLRPRQLLDLLLSAAHRMRVGPQSQPHSQLAHTATGLDDGAALAHGTAARGDAARVYLERVRNTERLTPEREAALFKQARDPAASDLDRSAAQREVVRATLWLVPVVVRRFCRPGGAFEDLVAEGNMGLYKAFDRYDPGRGFRFSSYAKWWVVDAVTSAMAAGAYAVRVPRRVALQMVQARRADGQQPPTGQGHEPPAAEAQGYVEEHAALQGGDIDAEQVADSAPSPDEIVSLRQSLRLLSQAVAGLPQRERRVIEGRYGLNGREQMTLQQIADELGLSAERVRTIQVATMAQLRQHFARARCAD